MMTVVTNEELLYSSKRTRPRQQQHAEQMYTIREKRRRMMSPILMKRGGWVGPSNPYREDSIPSHDTADPYETDSGNMNMKRVAEDHNRNLVYRHIEGASEESLRELEEVADYVGLGESDKLDSDALKDELNTLYSMNGSDREEFEQSLEYLNSPRYGYPIRYRFPYREHDDPEFPYGRNNPYQYPRAYVAGKGRKDFREKSPEWSDPDLPKLQDVGDVDTIRSETSPSTELVEEYVPTSVRLLQLKEETGLDLKNNGTKQIKPGGNIPYLEEWIKVRQEMKYFNDSWTLATFIPQLKIMERRIRNRYNLTRKMLVKITDTRPTDVPQMVMIAPHLKKKKRTVVESLLREINETLPS